MSATPVSMAGVTAACWPAREEPSAPDAIPFLVIFGQAIAGPQAPAPADGTTGEREDQAIGPQVALASPPISPLSRSPVLVPTVFPTPELGADALATAGDSTGDTGDGATPLVALSVTSGTFRPPVASPVTGESAAAPLVEATPKSAAGSAPDPASPAVGKGNGVAVSNDRPWPTTSSPPPQLAPALATDGAPGGRPWPTTSPPPPQQPGAVAPGGRESARPIVYASGDPSSYTVGLEQPLARGDPSGHPPGRGSQVDGVARGDRAMTSFAAPTTAASVPTTEVTGVEAAQSLRRSQSIARVSTTEVTGAQGAQAPRGPQDNAATVVGSGNPPPGGDGGPLLSGSIGADVTPELKGNPTPDAGQPIRAGSTSLADQIVTHARLFATAKGKGVHIRLEPPELGSLEVRLVVESRQVTLRVTAETTAARELIESGWPGLQEGLAGRGLRVERLTIDQGSLGGGGGTFASSGNADSPTPQTRQPYVLDLQTEDAFAPGKERRRLVDDQGDSTSLIDYRV